jgi:hypothetical protein
MALAALLLCASAATAAGERTYAVMSMVGDGVTVVEHRPTAGSSLSERSSRFVPFDERVFDRGALVAMEAGIHHADPGAKVVLLAGRDGAAMDAQKQALGGDAVARSVAGVLRPKLPSVGATHLLLLLKSRDRSPLPYAEGKVDAGELEGIGFYTDPSLVTRRDELVRGYFAPFAYFEVALVDLASGQVVAERAVRASRPFEASESGALKPWEALDADGKVRELERLLDDQAEAATTALVGAR